MNAARACGSTKRDASNGRICPSPRFGRVAEHQFEMGICREGGRFARPEQPDVDAFVNRLEQPCEGVGAVLGQRYLPCSGAGVGVSLLGKRGR